MSNRSERRKEVWKDREINNKCIYCGKNEPTTNRKGCVECLSKKSKKTCEFSLNNKDKSKQYRLLVKNIVIEKYGGLCNCCGESQILFLTIDHINNDEHLERGEKYSTLSFYLKLKREKIRNDIQVLCFNCNLGKSINNGICPHIEINRKLSKQYDKRHEPNFDINTKITWPDDDILITMCNETSITAVSKKLGVDFSSVSGRLKRRGKYELVIKKNIKAK